MTVVTCDKCNNGLMELYCIIANKSVVRIICPHCEGFVLVECNLNPGCIRKDCPINKL